MSKRKIKLRISLPDKPKAFYSWWINTGKGFVGPYGKKEWAESVAHSSHKVIRRKRGTDPNIKKSERKRRK